MNEYEIIKTAIILWIKIVISLILVFKIIDNLINYLMEKTRPQPPYDEETRQMAIEFLRDLIKKGPF